MNKDTLMMKTIDMITLHAKALGILQNPGISYLEADGMIKEMFRHYMADSEDYYEKELDECCAIDTKSDLEELIEDDNRERARDMNAQNRSPF